MQTKLWFNYFSPLWVPNTKFLFFSKTGCYGLTTSKLFSLLPVFICLFKLTIPQVFRFGVVDFSVFAPFALHIDHISVACFATTLMRKKQDMISEQSKTFTNWWGQNGKGTQDLTPIQVGITLLFSSNTIALVIMLKIIKETLRHIPLWVYWPFFIVCRQLVSFLPACLSFRSRMLSTRSCRP